MKPLVLIISVCLLIIFALSIRNSVDSFQNLNSVSSLSDNSIVGFDPAISENSDVKKLEEKFTSLIVKEKMKIDKTSNWAIVLNLLITIITGICALITTISTIKNNSVTKSIAIAVAIITFVSSLLSYSLSQVNSFKENSESRKMKIIEIRTQFHSLKNEEVISQLEFFNSKLDEEL